jgi:hypothetical protein
MGEMTLDARAESLSLFDKLIAETMTILPAADSHFRSTEENHRLT